MAGSAAGSFSVEDIELCSRLTIVTKSRRLQIKHRPVAATGRHQFLVSAELDDPAPLEHTNAIGVTDR